jgi:ribulose-phosphate 3-epimerase
MKSEFMIAPSILSADFANLEKEIKAVTAAGADWIHVDVMDGHFVPNLTIGAPVVKSLKPVSTLPLDCHLMIDKPERYIEDFAKAGADYITIHVEATREPKQVLNEIRKLGVKSGITLRPATSLEEILPYLELSDLILIMTVNPGFSGQSFMPESAAKCATVREALKKRGLTALIEVDGGINPETAKQCRAADVLVAGNAVFKAGDYKSAIAKLKSAKT